MSPSMISVLFVISAIEIARLLATVVLPSEGVELVMRMQRGGLPVVESSSEVRRERRDSANWDLGEARTAILRSAGLSRSLGSMARRFLGMMASEGSWVMASRARTSATPRRCANAPAWKSPTAGRAAPKPAGKARRLAG